MTGVLGERVGAFMSYSGRRIALCVWDGLEEWWLGLGKGANRWPSKKISVPLACHVFPSSWGECVLWLFSRPTRAQLNPTYCTYVLENYYFCCDLISRNIGNWSSTNKLLRPRLVRPTSRLLSQQTFKNVM